MAEHPTSWTTISNDLGLFSSNDVLSDCGIAPSERNLNFIDELALFEKMTSAVETPLATEDFQDVEALKKVTEGLENGKVHILYGNDEFLTSAWPLQEGDNYPEEVLLEVEVISSWEEEKDERTVIDLGTVQRILDECESSSNGAFSDYGSESGGESMDLSTNETLDLSKKDSNLEPPSLETPNSTYVNLTRAHIPSHIAGTVFDMGQAGVVSYNNNSFLHCSGGTTTSHDVTKSNDVDQNVLLDLSKTGQYYDMPRIKLDSNLKINPNIQYSPEMDMQYKPEMDYNHNEAVTSTVVTPETARYETVMYDEECMAFKTEPVEMDDVYDSEPRVTVVQNYSSQCQNIPLTVTSPDDENDSGTESISSKDSDKSCNNKSDRKRPGRKKGQVSKVYHLWEFIRDVLADPKYCPSVIKWENEEEGIFRVVQSETAASLWGARKNNRTKMTYEKMSRSIRYSRKEGYFADIPKDKGYPKKLCFKFGKKAHGWSSKTKL